MNRCRRRSGFTLVEVIAVLMLLAVIMAITVPSMIGFIEHGKQVNRMNIARTLYLAAQNQLTKSMTEKTLKSTLTGINSVADALGESGGSFPASDKDNEEFVYYISKPKWDKSKDLGTLSSGLAGDEKAFFKLLDEIIIDKSILYDAILMEYNIETGVVLSVFYGDMLTDNTEFEYKNLDAFSKDRNNVAGNRGMSAGGYEFADARKQGYYGVESTGELQIASDLKDIVNIYDGSDMPLDTSAVGIRIEERVNVLYAELLLANTESGASYSFEAVNAKETGDGPKYVIKSADVDLSELTDSFGAAVSNGITGKEPIYRDSNTAKSIEVNQYGVNVGGFYTRYIWVIDYIAGDILSAQPNGIGRFMDGGVLFEPQEVRAKVIKTLKGENAVTTAITSLTVANTHFGSRLADGTFEIKSARHLNNIRYLPDGGYRQTAHIDMGLENNIISNFDPIGNFGGEYFAMKDGNTQWKISNLIIDATGLPTPPANVGLFAETGGKIQGLSLYQAEIKAKGASNAGAIAGRVTGGEISQSNSYANVTGGGGNTGGLVGVISGGVLGQSFNAGFFNAHEDTKTSGGFGSVTAGGGNAGGLVGSNAGTIQDCFNNARVNIKEVSVTPPAEGRLSYEPEYSPFTGGSLGGIAGSSNGTVKNSYATNFVGIYDGSASGGIAGSGSGAISGCSYISNGCDDEGAVSKEELQISMQIPFVKGVLAYGAAAGFNTYDKYPYSALGNNNPFTAADIVWGWEDIEPADTDKPLAAIVYYELYNREGTQRGYMSSVFHQASTLTQTEIAVHDGYSVEFVFIKKGYKLMIGGKAFTIESGNQGASWSIKDSLNNEQNWFIEGPVPLTLDGNDIEYYRVYIPNNILEAPPGSPVAMAIYEGFDTAPGDEGVSPLNTQGNVLFAPNNAVRSPRHIDNINRVPGGSYTQQLNIDFTVYRKELVPGGFRADHDTAMPQYTAAVVSEDFNGSYNGNSRWIANVTVSGSSNDAGLFAVNKGSITNVTLRDPSITGGTNVGAVAGRNTGRISSCLVQQTADVTKPPSNHSAHPAAVKGTANVGGIAGNSSGTLTDVAFVSTSGNPAVQGTIGTVGGIVGSVSGGTVDRIMYLAVAPRGGGTLYPFAGSGPVGSAKYYLSGTKALRPYQTYAAPNLVTDYNYIDRDGQAAAAPTPQNTLNITKRQRFAGWNMNTLTDQQAVSQTNQTYPYPYPTGTAPPAAGGWPIVADIELSERVVIYYEKYNDGTYGVYTRQYKDLEDAGKGYDDFDYLNYRGVIVECGYGVSVPQGISLNGNYQVFGRKNNVDSTWIRLSSDFKTLFGATSPSVPVPTFRVPHVNTDFVALSSSQIAQWLSANRISPVEPFVIWVNGQNGNNIQSSPFGVAYINPLFAKEIYPINYNAASGGQLTGFSPLYPTKHFIRTPWHMQNISRATESVNYSAGHMFVQDAVLDFTTTVASATVSQGNSTTDLAKGTYPIVTASTANIVAGTFNGIYDGNGKIIKELRLPRTGANTTNNKGLFNTIGQDGVIENLTMADCAFQGGNNNGSFAAINNGTIRNAAFVSAETAAPIGGTNSGGIVWTNNGTIKNTLYIARAPGSSPIFATGAGSAADAYYLSGSLPSVFNNFAAATGKGVRKTTQQLNAMTARDLDRMGFNELWNPSGVPASDNTMTAGRYPYPYLGTEAPGSWPVATLAAEHIAYYEKYEDGIGFFYPGYSGVHKIDDTGTKQILEYGYCAIMSMEYDGKSSVKQGASGANTLSDAVWDEDIRKYYVVLFSFVLPNTPGPNPIASGNSAAVEVYMNDYQINSPESRFVNTLFAKGVYSDDRFQQDYYIRTPQQMQRISTWTGTLAKTGGVRFTQERPLDFIGLGFSAGAVVTDEFRGIFNGGAITNLFINAKDVKNVGLFSQNSGSINNISLKNATITGDENVGGIVGWNKQGGTVINCTVTESAIGDNEENIIIGRDDAID